jgi:ribosomal protein S18 acetylase RimI-like enzyme
MELKIRRATADDAAFVAWLILAAGRAHVKRGVWEVILNRPEEDCLRFLEALSVTAIPHLFHYSCFLIAETEAGPAAGLGGYDPDTMGHPRMRESLPEVYAKLGIRSLAEMAGRPPRIIECIPPPVEGAWTIDSVATLPAYRNQGIADSLIERILAEGRQKGYRQAELAIYLGNTPAQRAYEKHGFRVLDEWPDPYFAQEIGSPGMARMIRDL